MIFKVVGMGETRQGESKQREKISVKDTVTENQKEPGKTTATPLCLAMAPEKLSPPLYMSSLEAMNASSPTVSHLTVLET